MPQLVEKLNELSKKVIVGGSPLIFDNPLGIVFFFKTKMVSLIMKVRLVGSPTNGSRKKTADQQNKN